MQRARRTGILMLSAALLTTVSSSHGAIESSFDDQAYPGAAGDGWEGPWQHSSGTPEIRTDNPMDGGTPYIRQDTTETSTRNFMRQYASGAGVDITQPHTIRWKFRVPFDDLSSVFTVFNDSVHFFARHAPRLGSRADGNSSWQMWATGTAHSSGASAGRTFWIFDNVDGTGNYNLINNVDSQVQILPHHIYAFAVTVFPETRTFTVSIVDETSGVFFVSSAPHRFRSATATETSHTILHFGVQASPSSETLPFDLDSVSITQGELSRLIEDMVPEPFAIHPAAEGISFTVSVQEPVADDDIRLIVNGVDVSSQLVLGGEPTHRTVLYSGLVADEEYAIEVGVTYAGGTVVLNRTFYTATGPFTLYDSEGFASSELYPVGVLQPVTHGRATWMPHASEPSEVLDIGAPQGKVLERMNTGAARADWVHFPPVSSGTIVIEFDAIVSTLDGRTIDVALSSASSDAVVVAWGAVSGKLVSPEGAAWQLLADLEEGWQHYKVVSYLSGPAAGRFDVLVNGTVVGDKIPWGNAAPGAALGRFRLQSHQSGPFFEYGRIDNLVITAAPEDPNAFPPPEIINIQPFNHAVIRPEEPVTFEITSPLPISAGNVSVLLNDVDISSNLSIAGSESHLFVSYTQLQGGQHTLEINASNPVGTTTTTLRFVAAEAPVTIFDSGGFEDDAVYPLGFLEPMEVDGSTWTSGSGQSAEVTVVEAPYNKVLRKYQRGVDGDRDYLDFPPVSTGILTISFDVRVSATDGRTLDVFLLRPGQTAAAQQASILIWGHVPNQVTYYDGAYRPIFALDEQWHRFEMINDLASSRFDLKIDGEVAGTDLMWRNTFAAGTSLGRLRLGITDGPLGQFAEMDNLVITATPAPVATPAAVIQNWNHSGSQFSFSFETQSGFSYVVEYTETIGENWIVLTTIPGTGSLETATDDTPGTGQRYYRVRTE